MVTKRLHRRQSREGRHESEPVERTSRILRCGPEFAEQERALQQWTLISRLACASQAIEAATVNPSTAWQRDDPPRLEQDFSEADLHRLLTNFQQGGEESVAPIFRIHRIVSIDVIGDAGHDTDSNTMSVKDRKARISKIQAKGEEENGKKFHAPFALLRVQLDADDATVSALVVTRGTKQMADLRADLDSGMTEKQPDVDPSIETKTKTNQKPPAQRAASAFTDELKDFVPMHTGFFQAAVIQSRKIRRALVDDEGRPTPLGQEYQHANNGDGTRFIFTGHSLGGALAQINSLLAWEGVSPIDYVRLLFPDHPPPRVFSFGSPRVGGREYAAAMERSGIVHVRIASRGDPIIRFPSTSNGYQHWASMGPKDERGIESSFHIEIDRRQLHLAQATEPDLPANVVGSYQCVSGYNTADSLGNLWGDESIFKVKNNHRMHKYNAVVGCVVMALSAERDPQHFQVQFRNHEEMGMNLEATEDERGLRVASFRERKRKRDAAKRVFSSILPSSVMSPPERQLLAAERMGVQVGDKIVSVRGYTMDELFNEHHNAPGVIGQITTWEREAWSPLSVVFERREGGVPVDRAAGVGDSDSDESDSGADSPPPEISVLSSAAANSSVAGVCCFANVSMSYPSSRRQLLFASGAKLSGHNTCRKVKSAKDCGENETFKPEQHAQSTPKKSK